MQTKAEISARHPPPRSGLVQLLSELPLPSRNAGQLISDGGTNDGIEIRCNIHQLLQFVNVKPFRKNPPARRVSSLMNGGLTRLKRCEAA
jgi:hypothetical protein